jgi:hypothetical protein
MSAKPLDLPAAVARGLLVYCADYPLQSSENDGTGRPR